MACELAFVQRVAKWGRQVQRDCKKIFFKKGINSRNKTAEKMERKDMLRGVWLVSLPLCRGWQRGRQVQRDKEINSRNKTAEKMERKDMLRGVWLVSLSLCRGWQRERQVQRDKEINGRNKTAEKMERKDMLRGVWLVSLPLWRGWQKEKKQASCVFLIERQYSH